MVQLMLLSTVLMGLLVAATFIAVAKIGAQRERPRDDEPAGRYETATESLSNLARTPAVWSIAFVVITLGVGVVALLAVGDFGLPEGAPDTLLSVAFGLIGLLLTGFVFLGAYFGARGRGLGNAHGVAAGSFAAGLVFLVLVTAQLLVGVVG